MLSPAELCRRWLRRSKREPIWPELLPPHPGPNSQDQPRGLVVPIFLLDHVHHHLEPANSPATALKALAPCCQYCCQLPTPSSPGINNGTAAEAIEVRRQPWT